MQERLTPAVVNSLDELETQFAKTHCLVTPAALDVVCQRTACKTPAVQNRPAERGFFFPGQVQKRVKKSNVPVVPLHAWPRTTEWVTKTFLSVVAGCWSSWWKGFWCASFAVS